MPGGCPRASYVVEGSTLRQGAGWRSPQGRATRVQHPFRSNGPGSLRWVPRDDFIGLSKAEQKRELDVLEEQVELVKAAYARYFNRSRRRDGRRAS